jgi:hypothetical protein
MLKRLSLLIAFLLIPALAFAGVTTKGVTQKGVTLGYTRFVPADVPISEAEALINFYNAAGGDSWTDNTDWTTDTTVGNWEGITVSGGHVTAVDLSDNNLDNVLTKAQSMAFLNGLPSMTELRLQDNADFGLTFSIADNSTLNYLYVHNTDSAITGSIADNSTLTILWAYNTDSAITGSIADNSTLNYLWAYNTSSVITGSIADNSTLNYLQVHNTSSVITGSIADNSTLNYLRADNTDSAITGSIADNSTLNYLRADNTDSVITGSIADNSTLTILRVHSTDSAITGGVATLPSYSYSLIDLRDLSMIEAEVDEVLENIYRLRANFDDATPELYIDGSGGTVNATPSGVYQDGDPPTTGLEYVYELANDPETEGFNTWTITYNGGSAP